MYYLSTICAFAANTQHLLPTLPTPKPTHSPENDQRQRSASATAPPPSHRHHEHNIASRIQVRKTVWMIMKLLQRFYSLQLTSCEHPSLFRRLCLNVWLTMNLWCMIALKRGNFTLYSRALHQEQRADGKPWNDELSLMCADVDIVEAKAEIPNVNWSLSWMLIWSCSRITTSLQSKSLVSTQMSHLLLESASPLHCGIRESSLHPRNRD